MTGPMCPSRDASQVDVMGMSDKGSDLRHEDQVVPMATLRLVFCDMDSTFLADDKSIPRDNASGIMASWASVVLKSKERGR